MGDFLVIVFLLVCLLCGVNAALSDEILAIPVDPARFTAPPGVSLDAPAKGFLRVTKDGTTPPGVVRFTLTQPLALPVNADWFTVLVYPVRDTEYAQGQSVTFVATNTAGEEIKAKSLSYTQNFWGQMGWQNLLSETTAEQPTP